MATDAPSWLTEENVKSAIKVSENPTARKIAKDVAKDPSVRREVTKAASMSISNKPNPSSDDDAPGWTSPDKISVKVDGSKDIESGSSRKAPSGHKPLDEEEVQRMQKWHIALRIMYMAAAIFLAVAAGLTFPGQTDIGRFFFACYVIFFAALIFCFECGLSAVSRQMATNCGFMYTRCGRFTFVLFVGFMAYGLSLISIIAMAVLYAVLCFHIFIMFKFPNFERYLREKHFSEGRDSPYDEYQK